MCAEHAIAIQANQRRLVEHNTQLSLGRIDIDVLRQKAAELERKGEETKAKDWRRIEAALKEMAGPHQS